MLTLFFLTFIIIFAIGTLALLEQVRSRLLVRASIRFDRQLSGLLLDTALSGRGSTGEAMNKQILREFDALRQALTGPTILSIRSEEHTSELQSLMRISYAVFCLKKKKLTNEKIQGKHTKNKEINTH